MLCLQRRRAWPNPNLGIELLPLVALLLYAWPQIFPFVNGPGNKAVLVMVLLPFAAQHPQLLRWQLAGQLLLTLVLAQTSQLALGNRHAYYRVWLWRDSAQLRLEGFASMASLVEPSQLLCFY